MCNHHHSGETKEEIEVDLSSAFIGLSKTQKKKKRLHKKTKSFQIEYLSGGFEFDCIRFDKVRRNISFFFLLLLQRSVERVKNDLTSTTFKVSFLSLALSDLQSAYEREKNKEAGDVEHTYVGIHQFTLCLLSLPSYQAHIHDITPGHSPHPLFFILILHLTDRSACIAIHFI